MADDKEEKLNIREVKLKIQDDSPREEKPKKDDKLSVEIFCILMIVIGLLLLISIFNKKAGYFGELINDFLFFIFGNAAFTIPFIIIFFGIYFYTKKDKLKKRNIILILMMLVATTPIFFISSLSGQDLVIVKKSSEMKKSLDAVETENNLEIEPPINAEDNTNIDNQNKENTIIENPNETTTLDESKNTLPVNNNLEEIDVITEGTFFQLAFQGGRGGLLGSLIGTILFLTIGRAGALLFISTVMLIIFMLITGKSFLSFVMFIWLWILARMKKKIYQSKLYPSKKDPKEEFYIYDDDDDSEKKPGFFRNSRLYKFIMSNFEDEDFDDFDDEDFNDEDDFTIEIPKKSIKNFENDDEDYNDILLPSDKSEPDKVISFPDTEATIETEISSSEYEIEPEIKALEKISVEEDSPRPKQNKKVPFRFPSVDLLNKSASTFSRISDAKAIETSEKLVKTLKSFGVDVKVVGVRPGPTVTRYELVPGEGVKVSKISSLADDIALNLAAQGIRIEAPIPGKSAVGIEVPNQNTSPVFLRDIIDTPEFKKFSSKLAFGIGKDIEGNVVVADIAKMPHLLIAGATGSGKSVCINTLIISILYKANPDEVKLLMIDPKVVELSSYNGIPHLLIPVVTDPKKAAGALNWAVKEMINRYNLFSESGVRDLAGYNDYLKLNNEELLPQIVIIIDELADLMMASPNEVEDYICRLAQMARAAGMHLIIATQRPSVDVITGLIKANIPSRLAFSVSSGTDSRTILDMVGAEKLLGRGDMLFYPAGVSKPQRLQGAFISDKEVEKIVGFLKPQKQTEYDEAMVQNIVSTSKEPEITDSDAIMDDAIAFIIQKGKASASMLQRQFRIGYNRASRIVEELETRGIIGPEDGSKPRKVLMSPSEFEEYKMNKIKE